MRPVVLDTSAVVDYLLGTGAAGDVADHLGRPGNVHAPDVLVFETLAVLRRKAGRDELTEHRAGRAVADLGDLAVHYTPALVLRGRAWALRRNLTVADALFLTLAEVLGGTLVTKDAGLAATARTRARVEVAELPD